jgi:hypothetical protein
MAKFGTYRNDPRTITAKFDSTCAETGAVIRKGDTCVYYPSNRKVYHVDSNTAAQFRSESFDMDVLGANY